MLSHFSGLWKHPDFLKLWFGQTVSEFGSRISRDAIPLIAVILLAATPAQMGLLVMAASTPILILGLFVGAWVDRLRRRPILIFADTARLLLLLTLPFMAFTDSLTMPALYIIAALMGILTLFFNLAYRSILPSLIDRENLAEGNSKLATTDSLAEIGGPAISGLLIQAVSAPIAVVFDAATFLVSAVSVASIRKPEPLPEKSRDENLLREMKEGVQIIWHHPILRTIAIGLGVRSFFGNFFAALYAFYAVRELGLTPSVLGIVVSAGGVGAILGALLSHQLTQRFGVGSTMMGALLFGSTFSLLTPLAGGTPLLAAATLIATQIVGDGAMTIFQINELTLRQMVVPDRLLGRANASMEFLVEGVAPLGALVGGAIATVTNARFGLLVAVLGGLATSIWMLFSPLRDLETHAPLKQVLTSVGD